MHDIDRINKPESCQDKLIPADDGAVFFFVFLLQAGRMRARRRPICSCARSCRCGWPTPCGRSTCCPTTCSASHRSDWCRNGEISPPWRRSFLWPPPISFYSGAIYVISDFWPFFFLILSGTCRVLWSCSTMRTESRRMLMLWTSEFPSS